MNDFGKSSRTSYDDDSSFDAIQSNFQKVISALVNDNSLDAFRIEYEKLFTSLENSHQCNQQLIERIRQLNTEINVNSSKVQSALRFSQEDQKTINILRRDFEKAWQTVEALHARESRSKEIISSLKAELVHLSELAEKQSSIDTVGTQKKLKDSVDELQKEIETNNQLIQSLQEKLNTSKNNKQVLSLKIESLSNIQEELENDLNESAKEIKDGDNEGEKLTSSLDEVKRQNDDFKDNFDKISKELTEKQGSIANSETQLRKDQQSISEFGITIRYHQGKISEYQKKLNSKQKSIELLNQQREQLSEVVDDKIKLADELKDELEKLNSQRQKIDQQYEECSKIHKERSAQINQLKQQLDQFRKQKLAIKRALDSQDLKNQSNQRNVSAAQQAIAKTEDNCKKRKDEFSFCRAQSENLQKDLIKNMQNQSYNRKSISDIEDEIALNQNETNTTRSTVNHIEMETLKNQREIRNLEIEIQEINRQKQSTEAAIKEISDHHAVESRRYLQLSNENTKIESDLHFLKLNVTEFKETITKSDNQCMETVANRRVCEDQIKKLNDEINKIKKNIENTSGSINKINDEITTKSFILNQSRIACTDLETDLKNTRINMDSMEREISKRTKELDALREKSRIITSTFSKSGIKYSETTSEIDKLKSELEKEMARNQILVEKRKHVDKLNKEFTKTEKELIIAQTKSKLMEEESSKPISIHRWHLLESTNPAKFEQIQMKVALLDKITTLLNRERNLKYLRDEYEKKVSSKTNKLTEKRDSSEIEAYKKLNQVYKEKIDKLNGLTEKTQKTKEEADEWRDRVNYKESLIIEQKEQFYITKQREVAVSLSDASARISEPKISFNRGQAPRSIVPRLKIVEPKSNDQGKKSYQRTKNSPRNVVARRKPAFPLLPPLVPKTVR